MLVDTSNLVSAEQFRAELDKYVTAVQQGQGPIAVTRDAQVLGFFLSAEEYEAMFAATVQELLAARSQGATISHEEARAHVRKTIQAVSRKK